MHSMRVDHSSENPVLWPNVASKTCTPTAGTSNTKPEEIKKLIELSKSPTENIPTQQLLICSTANDNLEKMRSELMGRLEAILNETMPDRAPSPEQDIITYNGNTLNILPLECNTTCNNP